MGEIVLRCQRMCYSFDRYCVFLSVYSNKLLLLGFPWAITAPLCMIILALFFKKNIGFSKKQEGRSSSKLASHPDPSTTSLTHLENKLKTEKLVIDEF